MTPNLYKAKAQFYYLYTKLAVPTLSQTPTTFQVIRGKGEHGTRYKTLKSLIGWSRVLTDRLNWKSNQGPGHKSVVKSTKTLIGFYSKEHKHLKVKSQVLSERF